MKKFILIIAILCIGCDMTKNTPNLGTNSTASNKNKEVINEPVNSTKKYLEEPRENIEGIKENKENKENVVDTTKTWYGENKDELKEISKEIMESDKENIQNVIDTTKTWYGENKEELKEISKEIIENDKDTINDLYNKIKNIE